MDGEIRVLRIYLYLQRYVVRDNVFFSRNYEVEKIFFIVWIMRGLNDCKWLYIILSWIFFSMCVLKYNDLCYKME